MSDEAAAVVVNEPEVTQETVALEAAAPELAPVPAEPPAAEPVASALEVPAEGTPATGDPADVHTDMGFAAAAARAAAIAQLLTNGGGEPGAEVDAGIKRKHDGEGDEQSQKKYTDPVQVRTIHCHSPCSAFLLTPWRSAHCLGAG